MDRERSFYRLGADATWEIDVWGRIARSVEAAEASLEANVENYRDILVILYAEVALGYIETRSLQARIRFATANVQSQQAMLQLVSDRFDAGLVPQLDVRQAELIVASTESVIPTLQTLLTGLTMIDLAVRQRALQEHSPRWALDQPPPVRPPLPSSSNRPRATSYGVPPSFVVIWTTPSLPRSP